MTDAIRPIHLSPADEAQACDMVAAAARDGTRLEIRGSGSRRGLGDPATGKRGDLLARLMIVLPDVIDGELEAFAATWRAQRPYAPRRKP